MSKDPYYKCNTVTPEEQSDLQNQGAKFANDTKTDVLPIIILDCLIIIGFIVFNMKIFNMKIIETPSLSSSLFLFILVIFLFIVLVLWFTGIARSEGFKGKRKNKKGKSKKKSNGNKKKSNGNKKKSNGNKKSNRNNNSVTTGTKAEPKPVKQKSNLNPTLIAVLPVLAFGFIATIANVLYHR
jgi:hypothetical protein